MFRPLPHEAVVEENKLLPLGLRIMFAGNIGSAQGFGTVLAAVERVRDHPDIHWVIVGDGDRRTWLKQELERRGLAGTIHFLGLFPEERMPYFFAKADTLR